jgi:hypothetical protein
LGLILLSGCTGQKLSDYDNTKPPFDIESYFTGPLKAWGLVQDRKGRVVRRFDVALEGKWEDGVGVLDEYFDYYDGEKQRRVWTIRKVGGNNYEGTASDILSVAEGKIAGSAMRWRYQMDLPVGDTSYRITFDDWLYQMNDGILINRSYLKKFGITVAELTLVMQKQ